MEALRATLPAEFLGDAGVRLGLQTTYLAETIQGTRNTPRKHPTTRRVPPAPAHDADEEVPGGAG